MRVILDGKIIDSKETLHSRISEKFSFPEYYGNNLDALYDCLTDIKEDTEFILINFQSLKDSLGKYADQLERVLDDAQDENSHLKISTE